MEGDVSRSFNLSWPSHHHPDRRLPPVRHSRRCGSGWLDQRFFSRRTLGGVGSYTRPRLQPVGSLSHPIPRILIHHQIPPRSCSPLPISQIFNLILSFPLLEDLAVIFRDEAPVDSEDDSGEDEMPATAQPLSPRIFTGTLELFMEGGIEPLARRLLTRPGGIHFRELDFTYFSDEDSLMAAVLVEECPRTLKSLFISWYLFGMFIQRLPLRR